MEKIIVNNKRRTVIYDTEKKVYKKYVRPKFKERLKIFFGLKRPQGVNAVYISKLLNKNGIKTYEIISHTKYSYVTKEVKGKTLIEKILEVKNDRNEINRYLNMYMQTVMKILYLNLCYTDFNFSNMIIDEQDEICLIDIDDMQDTWYCRNIKGKNVIPRLKKELKTECDRLKGLKIEVEVEKIFEKYIHELV